MHGILMLKMGKGFLNTEKVDYIKLTAFRMFPLKSKETEKTAWNAYCRISNSSYTLLIRTPPFYSYM